jgi:glutathione S-transferase
MITLYHAPRSRSTRFIWLLEELGQPYKIEYVTIRRGDGSGTLDTKDPHPHGKVPVIDDDGEVVFESVAIALYLTDKYPQAKLGPVVGDPKRGAYLTWLAYYTGVMEPAFTSMFLKIDPPRGTAAWVKVEEVLAYLKKTLERQPYLLGDTFTAADLVIGSTFGFFKDTPLVKGEPELMAYGERCLNRPAFARAMAKDDKG